MIKKSYMPNGKIIAICISPEAGEPLHQVDQVEAIAGAGLAGDRYSNGLGSFNKEKPGNRQVTLINAIFFNNTDYKYTDSRRNIITDGIELMWLVGREFQIGQARMRSVKYCDPCDRPTKLSAKKISFKEAFFDRGGIVAEILESGLIKVGDAIIPPPKGY